MGLGNAHEIYSANSSWVGSLFVPTRDGLSGSKSAIGYMKFFHATPHR